ncbi:MAG: phytoene desaturase family protein [Micrococcales bacterium]
MKKVVILGAGLSGLASAALLAKAGHQVTVLERNNWIGGKSRRIELLGQRMDTGPALVTFPEVWQKFLDTYDAIGKATKTENLDFVKLAEVGRYFLRDQVTDLPVKPNHKWHEPWMRFSEQHSALTPSISTMLTSQPMSFTALPALLKMNRVYGTKLTTASYIKSLKWMPKPLKEIVEIHTLNAGVSPKKTLALYASVTASMANQGIHVPVGGVNEITQKLFELAKASGAEIKLGEQVTKVQRKKVTTAEQNYECDLVVSSVDPAVLAKLMGRNPKPAKQRSCSGVAIYAVLKEPLSTETVTHSVIMPDDAEDLYRAISNAEIPKQTMAFVNYYRAHEIYPNTKPTVAVLLTAPADGQHYDLESEWVRTELERISQKLQLSKRIDLLFEDHLVLDPKYFGEWGSYQGALYGETRPLWQAGPFKIPAHHNLLRPWLYRVGASVHPGGGIPAVLGGVLLSLRRFLKARS